MNDIKGDKMIDEKCNGCIHQKSFGTGCDLDSDDDYPCFHYDHFVTESDFINARNKIKENEQQTN